MISFAFDQKEDIPFPLELKLTDTEGSPLDFSVQLEFNDQGPCLEGSLKAIGANVQLELISQKIETQERRIEDQEKALKNAVIIDSEMQESILTDTQNLSAEILELIKSLEVYAFPDAGAFDLDEYKEFLFNRNLQLYTENLRLLGNKIHGLKGNSGFLIPEAKQLCHQIEDITRPLAEQKLVLTETISHWLKQFIFKIEEMLEQFQSNPTAAVELGDWLEKTEQVLTQSRSF